MMIQQRRLHRYTTTGSRIFRSRSRIRNQVPPITKNVIVAVVLLFVLALNKLQLCNSSSNSTGCRSRRYTSIYTSLGKEPLIEWLDQLQIHLPDIQYTAKDFHYYVDVSIQIQHFICTHFTIQNIQSIYVPSSSTSYNSYNQSSNVNQPPSPPQMIVSVQNISASCTGIYSIHPGSIRGTVLVQLGTSISNDTVVTESTGTAASTWNALEWTMSILDNNNNNDTNHTENYTNIQQPKSIRTINASTQVQVLTLQFTGSISANILELFHDMIVIRINTAIQTIIVDDGKHLDLFHTQVDPIVSNYIQHMVHIVQPYLIPTNTTMYQKNNHHHHNYNNNNNDFQRFTRSMMVDPKLHAFNNNHRNDTQTSTTAIMTENENNNDSMKSSIIQYDTDVPVLYNALHTINTFVENHLHAGFLRPTTTKTTTTTNETCGGFSDGINGLLQQAIHLFGDSTLSMTLPPYILFHPISYHIPQYSKNVTFLVHNVSVSLHPDGPSNISTMNLLRPITTVTTTPVDINTTTVTTDHRVVVNQTTYFHNEIELVSNVSICINVTILISDVPSDDHKNTSNDSSSSSSRSSNTLNETFVIQIDMHHIHAAFDVTMDWKRKYLQNIITIGMIRTIINELTTTTTTNTSTRHMLYDSLFGGSSHTIQSLLVSPTMNCFLQGIDKVFVSGLLGIINLSSVTIRPILSSLSPYTDDDSDDSNATTTSHQQLEQDIDHLINTILDLVTSEYPLLVTTAMNGFIQTNHTVQNYINDYLARHIIPKNNSAATCILPKHSVATTSNTNDEKIDLLFLNEPFHWFNFSKIGLLRHLNLYLNQSTTLAKINEYVDCSIDTIQDMIRDMYIHDHTKNTTMALSDDSRSTMQFTDFNIKNIGQFQQIEFLLPSNDGLQLRNSFLWNNSIVAQHDLPEMFLAFQVDYQPLNITAMINVTILLNNVQWGIDTNIHFDEEKFQQMTLMELFSHEQCVLATINATDFEMCGTDRHLQYVQLVVNTTILMHTTNETMDIVIDTNDFPEVNTFASSMFDWFVDSMGDKAISTSKLVLADSPNMCYGEKSSKNNDNHPNNETYDVMKPMLLILLAVFMFLLPAVLLMKRPNRDTSSVEIQQQQPTDDNDLIEPLLNHQVPVELDVVPNDDDHADDISYGSESQCFMMNKNIPLFVRYAVPIAVIVTIVLLLSSNLSVGATVDVLVSNVYRNGQNIQIPSLFEFSLYNTARDMWKAQIYPLFFLVLVFSGIWPYLKLFLMLFAWMGPTSMISPTFRGQLLLKLDALSKFSLVDTYVLIVMMVAFRYRLPLLEESSLNVYVVPQFGFFGFLLATSASLLIGHVLVYYHRHVEIMTTTLSDSAVVGELTAQIEPSSPSAISLGYHAYQMGDGSKRRLTQMAQYVLGIWLLLVFSLFTIGVTQKCFVFEFGGLAGVLLSDDTNRVAYSVISFAAAIPTSTEHSSWMSTILLQFVFIFYTIIMPLTAVVFLTILWMVPMSWSSQYCFLVMAEIANAWSAMEVFCLSIVAALFEVGTFANFMVGHKCDWIDHMLASYHTTIGIDTCYSVTASVSRNAMFLVIGAILHSVLVSLVLRFVQSSIHERLLENTGDDTISDSRRTFVHSLVDSRWGEWIFENDTDNDIGNNYSILNGIPNDTEPTDRVSTTAIVDNGVDVLPVFPEELLTTPWEGVNDTGWRDAIEHDETWKEWKETTNVT